jgi:hypothetical protein
MATIYLNNLTQLTANWSIDYDSKSTDGDQEALSFNIATVDFASSYKVCYWTDSDKHCVNVSDGDAVSYIGDRVIRTMGA